MSVVPISMRTIFQAAGWFPGRKVAVAREVPADHPAHSVLAELGGLTLSHPSPNVTSITFRHVAEDASEMAAWEAALKTRMVGIADQDGGHAELYLTERGQVIGSSLIHPACFLVGTTIEDAIVSMGSGKRSKPMLLPGQDEIMLYGITFRQGDDEVIGPADLA